MATVSLYHGLNLGPVDLAGLADLCGIQFDHLLGDGGLQGLHTVVVGRTGLSLQLPQQIIITGIQGGEVGGLCLLIPDGGGDIGLEEVLDIFSLFLARVPFVWCRRRWLQSSL